MGERQGTVTPVGNVWCFWLAYHQVVLADWLSSNSEPVGIGELHCGIVLPLGFYLADLASASPSPPTTPSPSLSCSIYKSPNTIVSPPDLATPYKLSIAPDGSGALRFTFSSGAASCSDGLVFVDPDGGSCPEGTAPQPNPPLATAAALKTLCVPCDAGFRCPAGTATEQECGQGTYNQLWGAAGCLTCPAGTVSREGEWVKWFAGVN